ncbi:hypothetical protein MM236_19055 [Belliella sp. DSM 107340]|uniref:Uncharacterized protein n=1 Tax=Belliella calami TaxID=2923436 RepID=A0ABS9UU03_9BACT|nr:hypothetical protein [Belliella calami]MCH7400102.1 hypothetical protein [Belliella calami]
MIQAICIIAILSTISSLVVGWVFGHMIGKSMAQTEVIDYVVKNPSIDKIKMLNTIYPDRKPLFDDLEKKYFKNNLDSIIPNLLNAETK